MLLLEELQKEWETDSVIDPTNLGSESLGIPKLHHKYWRLLSSERLQLKKYASDVKALRLLKYEFYTQGPSTATKDSGWKLPPKGMVLKQEANAYVDSDSDVVNATLKMVYQEEKVAFLEDVLKTIHSRSYHIRDAIEFQKFMNGIG